MVLTAFTYVVCNMKCPRQLARGNGLPAEQVIQITNASQYLSLNLGF